MGGESLRRETLLDRYLFFWDQCASHRPRRVVLVEHGRGPDLAGSRLRRRGGHLVLGRAVERSKREPGHRVRAWMKPAPPEPAAGFNYSSVTFFSLASRSQPPHIRELGELGYRFIFITSSFASAVDVLVLNIHAGAGKNEEASPWDPRARQNVGASHLEPSRDGRVSHFQELSAVIPAPTSAPGLRRFRGRKSQLSRPELRGATGALRVRSAAPRPSCAGRRACTDGGSATRARMPPAPEQDGALHSPTT